MDSATDFILLQLLMFQPVYSKKVHHAAVLRAVNCWLNNAINDT